MDDLVARLCAKAARAAFVGRSPAFREIVDLLPRIAAAGTAVLIEGETGTGKEMAARALHYLSPRAGFPFIAVNGGALPDTLLEAELFGHERGAFTDAHARREGLIAQAEKGTLFLDEIDSLSRKAQVSLLRRSRKASTVPSAARNGRPTFASWRPPTPPSRSWCEPGRSGPTSTTACVSSTSRCRRSAGGRKTFPCWPSISWKSTRGTGRRRCFSRRPGRRVGPRLARQRPRAGERHDPVEPPVPRRPHRAGGPRPAGRAVGRGAGRFRAMKEAAVREFERTDLRQLTTTHGGNVTRAARDAGKDRRELGKLLKKHHIDPRSYLSPTAGG